MTNNSELDTKWISFLEDFFGDNFKKIIEIDESNLDYRFEVEQLFETEISLKRKYGFLSLHFKRTDEFERFLDIQGFILKSEDKMTDFSLEPITFSDWIDFKEVYPCRVYSQLAKYKKYISFYDKENILENDIIIENRIKTIQLIIQVVIQLKIEDCTKIGKRN